MARQVLCDQCGRTSLVPEGLQQLPPNWVQLLHWMARERGPARPERFDICSWNCAVRFCSTQL